MNVKTAGHLAHAMASLAGSAPVRVTVNGKAVPVVASIDDGALVLAVSVPEPKPAKKGAA